MYHEGHDLGSHTDWLTHLYRIISLIDFKLAYATPTSIYTLEYTTDGPVKSVLFSSDEDIQTFDVDWKKGWVIWADLAGRLKVRLLREGRSEYIPIPKPGMWHDLDLFLLVVINLVFLHCGFFSSP